ncbi:MAG TPA: carboxymuconolactone decarboxylase family protein [Methanomassiliicoccales archaeon]|nr:carboxymuconolactone decarboxylase family protein [Methanomassiliicoccales archaeon]
MSLALLAKQRPPVARALYKLKNEVFKSGALTVREKELIAVALSCLIRCETCLQFHADRAKEAGASKDDLREAMDVALYLGGPSALIWSPIIDEILSDDGAED